MKILHTADWHLGKQLLSFQRLAEQKDVMNEIVDIANREAVELVLIAGDLFDTFNPTPAAEDLLYETLKRLADGGRRAVVAIAGNHDNPERIEAQDHFARECNIVLTGFPLTQIRPFDCAIRILQSAPGFVELQLPNQSFPIRIILTPYANESRMRAYFGMTNPEDELRQWLQAHWAKLADDYMDDEGVNLLMAHLFVMKRGGKQPEECEGEKSILVGGASVLYSDLIPASVQYAALGHLHRYQHISGGPCPVVYSSSPLGYSFAEADQQKYVVLIEAEPGQAVSVTPVPLQQGRRLLRKKFTHVDDAVDWMKENPNCYTEITLQTPVYLTGDQQRQLHQAHDGLVTIIPDVRPTHSDSDQPATQQIIDLNETIDTLFINYFKTRNKGQEPNEQLLGLFQEILATDPE